MQSVLVDQEQKFFKGSDYKITIIEVKKTPFVEVQHIKTKQKVMIPFSNVVYLRDDSVKTEKDE